MTDFQVWDSETPGQVKLIAFQKYVRVNVKVEKLGHEFRIIPDRSGHGPDIMDHYLVSTCSVCLHPIT